MKERCDKGLRGGTGLGRCPAPHKHAAKSLAVLAPAGLMVQSMSSAENKLQKDPTSRLEAARSRHQNGRRDARLIPAPTATPRGARRCTRASPRSPAASHKSGFLQTGAAWETRPKALRRRICPHLTTSFLIKCDVMLELEPHQRPTFYSGNSLKTKFQATF